MNKAIIVVLIALLLGGCASVPPHAVTSQELILEGLKTARKNQITIIEAYASDQKQRKQELMQNAVIDAVISAQLKGRDALPPNEVKELIIEYAKDLQGEFDKVEKKKADLLKIANDNFEELEELAKINLEYMKSLRKATKWQQELHEQYKTRLESIEDEINALLKTK